MRGLAVYAILGGAIAFPVISSAMPTAERWLTQLMDARIEEPSRYEEAEIHLSRILEERVAEWQRHGDAEYQLRRARSKRLNRHLDEALAVLADSEAMALRQRLAETMMELQDWQNRLAEHRAELSTITADASTSTRCRDDDRSPIAAVACTLAPDERNALERRIKYAEERIEALRAEKARFIDDLAASLQEIGVPLVPEEIRRLVDLVSGDRILEAHAVYRGLSEVNDILVRAAEAGQDTLPVVKRYYGLHVVLVEVALHFHESFINEIRRLWLPRLANIRATAVETRARAQAMLAREMDPHLRKRLAANIEANDLSIRAVDLYAAHLDSQARDIAARWEATRRRHRVALNTYRTLTVQGDVVTVMRQASNSLEEAMLIELPPLHLFESHDLQAALEHLNGHLLASGR